MIKILCTDCGKSKPETEFYKNRGKNILRPCKDCRKAQRAKGLVGLKSIGR